MALQLGQEAPNFTAETTEGTIDFHDWIGDSWAVLFSHPKDFTPVCTTELGYMANAKPAFDERGVKIIGLSVDPLDSHEDWAKDIEETQGTAPNYPLISDADFKIAKAYGMLAADVEGDAADRTPADNQTVRNVFVIGPDKKIKLILVYPMTTGRNFDEVLRVIDSLQLTANHKVATPANWKSGDNFKPPPDSGFTFDFGNLGDLHNNKSFSDFFDMLFGQTFGSPQQQKAHGGTTRRQVLDQEADVELTLEELARGAKRTLQLSAPGGKPRTIEVKIPAGLRPGKKVRVPGEGATAGGSTVKGDLYLRIKVKPHSYFTIDGDNLVCELPVSPAQAVVGSEAVVTTIEGPVKIKIPAGTQSGRLLRLKGKGLPSRDGGVAGDQLVRTKIVIPTEISEKERELYSELARIEKQRQ